MTHVSVYGANGGTLVLRRKRAAHAKIHENYTKNGSHYEAKTSQTHVICCTHHSNIETKPIENGSEEETKGDPRGGYSRNHHENAGRATEAQTEAITA